MKRNLLAPDFSKYFKAGLLYGVIGLLAAQDLNAQDTLPLTDLSFFQNPSSSWRIASDVNASLEKINVLSLTPGTGVLVNLPDQKNQGRDLLTQMQHGDADVELEFMMAKGSNSGIYLQGRYELQLMDSWGTVRPKYSDNGGIYERWDEARGIGKEGYEGIPPRQNVTRAPGLWQKLKISFQAPRFDAAGRKTENAKILRAELNGILLHENIDLSGPTRGSLGPEVAVGPLRIQGDHGAIAFRNIKIANFDKARPVLSNLKYSVYRGLYAKEPDYAKLPPEASGPYGIISSNLNDLPDSFLLRYTGNIKIAEPGEYIFNLSTVAGNGLLKINNQTIVPLGRRGNRAKATLPAGDLPFELLYSKYMDWAKPSLALTIAGPGVREFLVSDGNVTGSDIVDPILIEANTNIILRSFIDLPGNIRLTHSVNVGSPQGLHYTYDLNKGTVAQAWRGGFLDATPMWHERGDGSSRPTGSVQYFGTPLFQLARLASPQDSWIRDSVGTQFRSKGYTMDEKDRPVFKYSIYGVSATDAVQVLENGQGIHRSVAIDSPLGSFYYRLAESNKIETVGDGLFLLSDKSYYIKMDSGSAGATVRDVNGVKELIVPIQSKVGYTVIF